MISQIAKKVQTIAIMIATVGMILQGCENRFGNTPMQGTKVLSRNQLQSNHISTITLEELDINDLIQYLKLHEYANWINIPEEELLEYVEKFKKNPELLQLVSDYYLSRENLDKALYYITKAEEEGARSIDFYKRRAEIFGLLSQYGLAIDYANKAVLINGNDPDIYLLKGDVYLKLGDSISSLQYKEQAFQQDSSRLDIASDLAYLYTSFGSNKSARLYINLLVDADYQVNQMRELNVTLLRTEKKNVEANKLLLAMMNDGQIGAGESLINYFGKQQSYDSMIHYATKLLEQDSTNVAAIEAKAISFDQKGYFASALMYYHQLLKIDSLNEEGLEGVRKVNGKIAYLRKLREQREAIPTFDFASPIKETN